MLYQLSYSRKCDKVKRKPFQSLQRAWLRRPPSSLTAEAAWRARHTRDQQSLRPSSCDDVLEALRAKVNNPATRNRTRDHLIAAAVYSQMLYQLSHSQKCYQA